MNELSEKFSYSLKTYNLLSIALMNTNEFEKASQIFENALIENQIYSLIEEGAHPETVARVLNPSNQDLASLIYNYIKCNAIKNGHNSISSENYHQGGL